MKRLIINADDFGIHTSVNQAVLRAYEYGLLKSTSLIAGGRAAEEAAMLAREAHGLGVGVHLTWVAESPVSDAAKVPSLVDGEGRFLPHHIAFIKRFLTGAVRREELRLEAEAQIKKILQLGVTPTHIDSHQHLHVLPGVIDMVLELAAKYGIRKLRIPCEPFLFRGNYPAAFARLLAKWGLLSCAFMARQKARRRGFSFPHSFYGMLAGGHLEEPYLLSMLAALPAGTSEIMMHPAADDRAMSSVYDWQYHWQGELAALQSPTVKACIKEKDIQCISYRELKDE
ncbi:ChbG/HpnK family deacetylase [Selenomonas sp. TAMA-11512]|uniref:ChbG/HpnK family deacetylase n=1 Tax=Selenomonas sp. TAMA-11512 TaxID=3095337 RepID=UPI0030CCFE73